VKRRQAPTVVVGSVIGVATFFAAAITCNADERLNDFRSLPVLAAGAAAPALVGFSAGAVKPGRRLPS
jgi:hypothetical protein